MFRPAYFASLTVRDLAGFRGEQTLDLRGGDGRPAKWTLLVGDFAGEATTLLQCLDHTSPFAWHDASQAVGGLGGTGPRGLGRALSGLVRAGSERCELRSEVILDQALASYNERAALRREFNLVVRGDGVDGIRYSTPFAMHCCGYGAGRRPGAAECAKTRELSATLHDAAATLPSAAQWLLQLDADARANPALRSRVESVKRALIDVLPGIDGVRIGKGDPSAVDLHGPDGWIGFAELEAEWQAVAAWIVDLAGRMVTAFPGSRDPLREATVALIDGIELNVEPSWQGMPVQRVEQHFPSVQFIASTRSPAVVAAAPDANVVVLRREGDGVVIDPPRSVRGWSIDQVRRELFASGNPQAAE